jgi:prolipoprotein diacylglyceryltransferase
VHPEIFHLGPFVLRSYGLALAIAFLVGVVVSARRKPVASAAESASPFQDL